MLKNSIYLESDSITICRVTNRDLDSIKVGAVTARCATQVIADNGIYCTVVVSGTVEKLYDFMQFALYGLRCNIVS